MQCVSVDLWRFSGICINGHEVVTHDFPDFEYGRMVIRTTDPNDLAFIDGFADPIFNEVADVIKELVIAAGRKNWYGHCFRQVFGIACDPAPSGKQYSLTERVRCPVCGSTELVRYGPGEPPKGETIELPFVTYTAWQELGLEEKRERLRQALQNVGCL